MNRLKFKALLILIVCGLCATNACSFTIDPPSLRELERTSDVIAIGSVSSVADGKCKTAAIESRAVQFAVKLPEHISTIISVCTTQPLAIGKIYLVFLEVQERKKADESSVPSTCLDLHFGNAYILTNDFYHRDVSSAVMVPFSQKGKAFMLSQSKASRVVKGGEAKSQAALSSSSCLQAADQ
ncbi:hypothetical protein C7S18_15790 [Ahniella affigens]|uniref:Lipoprotein n=1 Tax=Ahniella affigens TaxID=2021234 RepID=A0A2P1PUM9_9GAMM|nr:hypothetical protein [Ahniella affigens]AVP98557.1 hypothetical protein C7S18_15790 [Ahniella affigens]